MNTEDIMKMVEEASGGKQPDGWGVMLDREQLERFAKLVAAAEREACAKTAEAVVPRHTECGNKIAFAIRERGAP